MRYCRHRCALTRSTTRRSSSSAHFSESIASSSNFCFTRVSRLRDLNPLWLRRKMAGFWCLFTQRFFLKCWYLRATTVMTWLYSVYSTIFVYFLVRMRKCTRVSLKRPCSYRIRWGFLHFPAVFPPTGIFSFLFQPKKKETKLVSSFAWLCCCYYCGFMHESRGNWTRRYGQPLGRRVHRGLLFLYFF